MNLQINRLALSARLLFVICLLLGITIGKSFSQSETTKDTATFPYWIQMMQDPAANFHATQHAFEAYWKDKPITRGCGWKPFKRWEYMTSLRVNEDGSKRSPDLDKKEYNKYFTSHKQLLDNNAQWTELGPKYLPVNAPGLGRVNAIAFHPTDENIIYVGAPAGGLWKTLDGGQLWTSSTDNLPTLGVSAILVDYTDPEILFIGTGDRDAGDAPGLGVMKSTDGGATWISANSGMGNVTVGRMLMHPANHLILYAATNHGVFKSTDGGLNWNYSSPSPDYFKDLAFKPGNPDVIYAVRGGILFKSSNAGNSWNALTNGLPGGYRGIIGLSPANPEIVYLLLGNSDSYKGLYLSTDGGANFTEQSTTPNILSWGCNGGTGGQSWYDLALAVDPINPNIVYAGGVNVFKSTDAGQTWTICGHWYGDCGVAFIHADQHIFEWNPLNNKLYAGCDGGCFYTADEGTEWIMISQGLAIAQVYKIGQSKTISNLVINGYQDNGSAVYNDNNWNNVLGADGMECAIDPADPSYKYGTYYYGSLHRIHGFSYDGNIGGNNVNGITEEGAWVSPFIIHETDPNTIFLGMKSVWRSNNVKASNPDAVIWTKISGNFGSGNCRALEQSPANPNILYVIKESGKLARTDNANAANPVWTDVTLHLPSGTTNITDIEAHPNKAGWAYLCATGRVLKTTDKGLSWTNISGSLPNVPLNSIVYCPGSLEGLYVCTDIGVFYKDASLDDWVAYSTGLPPASKVTELDIYYDQNNVTDSRIRACTYGRGLWESELYQAQPQAGFVSDYTSIPSGCAVNFTDLSSGYPTSWKWSFPGATPSLSNQQNPANITYASPGNYDVTLIITNAAGSDTLTLTAYINVNLTILPNPGFSVNDSIFCSSPQVVYFTDSSKYCPTSWTWTFSPNTITFLNGTSANSQNPVVQFNEDGQYTVSLTIGNVNGTISINKINFIMIGGKPLPFTDDFETGSLQSKAWSIENPDMDRTWETWGTGGSPAGTLSARVKIFGTNTMGNIDRLVSPTLNFSGLQHPGLFFRHAYCQFQSDYSDTLIVMISDNCGLTWTKLYTGFEDGTGTFATRPPMTINFVPESPSDWCGSSSGTPCLSFDLSDYGNKKNIKIAFETHSFISNNIYIDDVNISSSEAIAEYGKDKVLLVYPNPAKNKLYLECRDKISQAFITNMLGINIMHNNLNDTRAEIDVSQLGAGFYGVKVVTDKGIIVEKFQVVR